MRSPLVMNILHTWWDHNAMQSSECRRRSLSWNLYSPHNNLLSMTWQPWIFPTSLYVSQDVILMSSYSMLTVRYLKHVNLCLYFSLSLKPPRKGTLCALSSPFPHWILCNEYVACECVAWPSGWAHRRPERAIRTLEAFLSWFVLVTLEQTYSGLWHVHWCFPNVRRGVGFGAKRLRVWPL